MERFGIVWFTEVGGEEQHHADLGHLRGAGTRCRFFSHRVALLWVTPHPGISRDQQRDGRPRDEEGTQPPPALVVERDTRYITMTHRDGEGPGA